MEEGREKERAASVGAKNCQPKLCARDNERGAVRAAYSVTRHVTAQPRCVGPSTGEKCHQKARWLHTGPIRVDDLARLPL